MMKFLRSQSQTVLAVVLAFIAIGFLFYGNAGNLLSFGGPRTSSDYGRIDGEDVTVGQLYDAVRQTRYLMRINGQDAALQRPVARRNSPSAPGTTSSSCTRPTASTSRSARQKSPPGSASSRSSRKRTAPSTSINTTRR